MRARYPTDLTVMGDATAISLAMAKRAHRVAELLVDSGLPLGPAPIIYAEGATAALVEKLIERDLTGGAGNRAVLHGVHEVDGVQ